jgi:hypothetical protein
MRRRRDNSPANAGYSDVRSAATAAGAVAITGVEGCAVWTAAGIPNAPIAPESAAASIRITDALRLGCACASMASRIISAWSVGPAKRVLRVR